MGPPIDNKGNICPIDPKVVYKLILKAWSKIPRSAVVKSLRATGILLNAHFSNFSDLKRILQVSIMCDVKTLILVGDAFVINNNYSSEKFRELCAKGIAGAPTNPKRYPCKASHYGCTRIFKTKTKMLHHCDRGCDYWRQNSYGDKRRIYKSKLFDGVEARKKLRKSVVKINETGDGKRNYQANIKFHCHCGNFSRNKYSCKKAIFKHLENCSDLTDYDRIDIIKRANLFSRKDIYQVFKP